MAISKKKDPEAAVLYDIQEELGTISENAKGWQLQLNLVSWGENAPKYDIRSWSPDRSRMTKGLTLTAEELDSLCELWKSKDEPDEM